MGAVGGLDLALSQVEEIHNERTTRRSQVEAGLIDAASAMRIEALASWEAGFWRQLYFGRGEANPLPARSAPDDALPFARTGFALEVVRLLAGQGVTGAEAVDAARAIWQERQGVLKGGVLAMEARHGRYFPMLRVPGDQGWASVPVYGGGTRWVALDAEADLRIALLEALYFERSTDGEVFLAFVDDSSAKVRATAVRLLRVTPSQTVQHEDAFTLLLAHTDPVVVQHARDGLKFREWTYRQRGRKPR